MRVHRFVKGVAVLALVSGAVTPAISVAAPGHGVGYPRQTQLRVHPDDPSDKSIKLGLLPYHALAPQLNELQALSDRVSVEVLGKSIQDRELYRVTLTLPETPAQARQQDVWRDQIKNNPAAAARDTGLKASYKAPVWLDANIHGDEWAGTDAVMRLARELATSTDPRSLDLLAHTRIVVNVTANPDGRVAGKRENAPGFDLNRDHITSSQPENVLARDLDIRAQPVFALDLHGYIEGTPIEPSNAPHGQNYEYDLSIKPLYDIAMGMEQAVKGLGYPEAQNTVVPFRDHTSGWDDWNPTLTAQYAPYHGAVGMTVELPLPVDAPYYNTLPPDELRRRSSINTDVASTVIHNGLDYVLGHRADLVASQIETFRRGAAGEPLRSIPDGFVPGFGPEDRSSTTLKRPVIAAAANGDEISVLRGMGFEVREVSTQSLNAGQSLSGADLLYISYGLRYDVLNPAAKTTVDAFLQRGNLILRGYDGMQFNDTVHLVQATASPGRRDVSGIVNVTNEPGNLGTASDKAFIYSPYWFTDLGPDVRVEQRLATGNPLIAGFWPPLKTGDGVATDAAGHPITISTTTAHGSRAVMFGTDPLFRSHTKATLAPFANAVYWTTTR